MPYQQFLQLSSNEKFDEISTKHNGERIGTEVAFIVALKAHYSPIRPIPSSDDSQPFSVVMLQADSERLAGGSYHVQISFKFLLLPLSKFGFRAQIVCSRT